MDTKIVFLFDVNLSNETKELLSIHLRSYGITLVPVTEFGIKNILKRATPTIICLSSTLEAIQKIERVKQKYFKLALINKKINIIDFCYNIKRDATWAQIQNYHCYGLPMEFSRIAEAVAKSYIEFLKINSRWPGGRRTRVPLKKMI